MSRIRTNTDGLEREIKKALNVGMEKVLANTVNTIVSPQNWNNFYRPPFISGQLKQSIVRDSKKTPNQPKAIIRSKKNYALYVEYGTIKMPARPFMRNGVARAERRNADLLTRELNKIRDQV